MAKRAQRTPVSSITHKDTRVNIPTEELRDFVAEDESAPKTMLYPRDPSLDPQLVWMGKDAQDAADLAVPLVPVYIQEKIHPQVLIDDLLKEARLAAGIAEPPGAYQLNLFADFNGLPEAFDQRVDFYQHEGHWQNRMILGDSLLVMASLAEKEGLKGQVQCIYFDPPYGIKFGSNWQVSTRKRDVRDGRAEDATRQPEQVRAFRDTWKLGIHSYLAYLRDRFVVARDLLTETGSIFVQIGDENVHLVRCVLDEVFGAENCVAMIAFAKTTGFSGTLLSSVADHVLWYARDAKRVKYRQLYRSKVAGDEGATKYRPLETIRAAAEMLDWHGASRLATSADLTSQGASSEPPEAFHFAGKDWYPPPGLHWKTTVRPGMHRLAWAGRIVVEGRSLRYLRFMDDFAVFPIANLWMDIGGIQNREEGKIYVVQTAEEAVARCLLMATDPGDLVLDPTCGSGTTAKVAEQFGRRWITVDTSRVAVALARTRMMSARYPYYLLADSDSGRRMAADLAGRSYVPAPTRGDVHQGFVWPRVPHITLESIANNPDIHEGMSREEIDAAIARHADSETLYDQPYEDNKTVRVSGPFTVESLSPHRVLATDEEAAAGAPRAEVQREQDFARMILDNLRTAGVQNTKQGERLKFGRLEPYPGAWLQAAGEYTDADGQVRRVAVSIGPEQGTVGPQQVKEAAKEAVQGLGYDLLLVCGFAFDPHVAEESTRYGSLTVLPVRMNPDLAMGDDLLKKTGAGNLFMIFGEPDVAITTLDDGRMTIEIKGVDVYDPTTGEIRSSSADDIACWFIDTDYDGESFFVRHAYFTGADEPYERLKRALRAEVDEEAWSSLYSTTSRPFARPKSGRFAVKVINHYGDEVLKVYGV